MGSEDSSWKSLIFNRLIERNKFEAGYFQDIILLQNKLFDNVNSLKSENVQLTVQNDKLRHSSGAGVSSSAANERIQQLEQKLLFQQEELTNLHRRRGENAQQIINLNTKLQETEKELQVKEESLTRCKSTIATLESDVSRLHTSLKELQKLDQHLRDEHQALQITCSALEDKLRKEQEEKSELVKRLIKYKEQLADKLNEENENFLKIREQRMQQELKDAAREGMEVEEEYEVFLPSGGEVPSKMLLKFDAHDGEVNAVKWSPTDKVVATGGADKKVKLWDISKGSYKSKGVLVGPNYGVMSVDFDSTGTMIIAGSNDNASQVWSVADQRLKVLTTLRFLATGSYQRLVGVNHQIIQRTSSRFISEVVEALISPAFANKWIKFPSTLQDRNVVKQEFQRMFKLPGVVGCIDCTHVAIVRPKCDEHAFYNRKGYHSLNVQMVCDSNLRILNVNPRFGGASHDSHIWASSEMETFMRGLHRNREHVWLLGDSGYPQRPWMMVPILHATPGSREDTYTRRHIQARNTIERCFGLLKSRWRCLLRHRTLHYEPEKAGKIVLACSVLHNIAIAARLQAPDGDNEEVLEDSNFFIDEGNQNELTQGRAFLNNLLTRLA